jgi:hypothetical protein
MAVLCVQTQQQHAWHSLALHLYAPHPQLPIVNCCLLIPQLVCAARAHDHTRTQASEFKLL